MKLLTLNRDTNDENVRLQEEGNTCRWRHKKVTGSVRLSNESDRSRVSSHDSLHNESVLNCTKCSSFELAVRAVPLTHLMSVSRASSELGSAERLMILFFIRVSFLRAFPFDTYFLSSKPIFRCGVRQFFEKTRERPERRKITVIWNSARAPTGGPALKRCGPSVMSTVYLQTVPKPIWAGKAMPYLPWLALKMSFFHPN